jgi:hypothetical protein
MSQFYQNKGDVVYNSPWRRPGQFGIKSAPTTLKSLSCEQCRVANHESGAVLVAALREVPDISLSIHQNVLQGLVRPRSQFWTVFRLTPSWAASNSWVRSDPAR